MIFTWAGGRLLQVNEFWVFFSLNQKQNMISEYKEKMTRQVPYTLTLLMFVEGQQRIRSAGVVGEKERQKKRKKDENGVREGVWSVREK